MDGKLFLSLLLPSPCSHTSLLVNLSFVFHTSCTLVSTLLICPLVCYAALFSPSLPHVFAQPPTPPKKTHPFMSWSRCATTSRVICNSRRCFLYEWRCVVEWIILLHPRGDEWEGGALKTLLMSWRSRWFTIQVMLWTPCCRSFSSSWRKLSCQMTCISEQCIILSKQSQTASVFINVFNSK